MKKALIVALSASLCIGCVAIAGCGSSQTQATSGTSGTTQAASGTEQATSGTSGTVANPMHESDKAGVIEATGIELNPPADADGTAKYFYYDAADEDSSPMAEMVFTGADGVEYTYRAESTGELKAFDNSGMNYTWDKPATATLDVNDCEATVETCDEAAVIYWLDIVPGVDYSLSANEAVSAEDMIAMANDVFETTQGEN